MANATRYSELRRRFTEEWINVGDCGVSHCTQSCCIGLESLFDTFGIEQDDMEEHFDGRCKSYRPTELLLESLRESKVFDWTGTFRVLNDLRQRRAWELENPLDGYMEIPKMVGDILTRLDWPNGFEKMRSQLPSTNRDRLHQWFVRAFVDELFPDSLLKKISAGTHSEHPAVTGKNSRRRGWLGTPSEAAESMQELLDGASIDIPKIPRWLRHQLRESADGWAWGTDHHIDSWAVYSLFDEAAPSQIAKMLSKTQPDFWLAGQRGHGVNSYGFGIVARVGPLFVAHQHLWGGVYVDNERATAAVNSGVEAWNATLEKVVPSIDETLRVAVVYSDYRDYAEIWVAGKPDSPDSSESRVLAPKGWRTLWAASGENDIAELWELHHHEDVVVAIAAGHLTTLIIDREMQHQVVE